jgi:hypothetical protein
MVAEAFMELSLGDPLQPTSSDLQLLPPEVLDLITEKVRRHSPQSFHAAARTNLQRASKLGETLCSDPRPQTLQCREA